MGWLLCKLHWHRWQYGVDYIRAEDGVIVYIMRLCARCGRLEEVPSIKTVKGGFVRGQVGGDVFSPK